MNDEERAGALSALTVIEASEGIAGPYAGLLFAQFGATVIKVEPPGRGDISRSWRPFIGPGPDSERSLNFLALNAGKLSLSLDTGTPEGVAVLQRLSEDADCMIVDYAGREGDAVPASPETLLERNPRLVIVLVSGFGADGPYSGRALTGLTLAAASGVLAKDAEGPVQDEGWEHLLGMNVFVAAMAGICRAAQTEHGQVVDAGGMQVLASERSYTGSGRTAGSMPITQAPGPVVEHPAAGTLTYAPPPFELSKAGAAQLSRSPLLGEHTRHVLQDLLGMDAEDVDALHGRGVV